MPALAADGEVVTWIGVAWDIEDARRTEAEAQEKHRAMAEALSLLDTLQPEAPVGLGSVDRDFR